MLKRNRARAHFRRSCCTGKRKDLLLCRYRSKAQNHNPGSGKKGCPVRKAGLALHTIVHVIGKFLSRCRRRRRLWLIEFSGSKTIFRKRFLRLPIRKSTYGRILIRNIRIVKYFLGSISARKIFGTLALVGPFPPLPAPASALRRQAHCQNPLPLPEEWDCMPLPDISPCPMPAILRQGFPDPPGHLPASAHPPSTELKSSSIPLTELISSPFLRSCLPAPQYCRYFPGFRFLPCRP